MYRAHKVHLERTRRDRADEGHEKDPKEILWLEQKKHRIVCIYLKNLVNTVLSLDMNIVIRLFTN